MWGSLFVDHRGTDNLMRQTIVQSKNLYYEYGFQTDEMADHIAAQPEFIGMLLWGFGTSSSQFRNEFFCLR